MGRTRGRRAVILVAATAFATLVAGCGGGSSSSGLGAGSPGAGGAGEATRSADQIFDDAVSAMREVVAVHITGTSTDASGISRVEADVTQHAARAVIRDPRGAVVVVVVGGRAYGAADGGGAFQELPAALERQAQSLILSRTADCAVKEHGHLTRGAVSTVDGHQVVAVADDGRVPGGAPGTIYVAVDSPHVLIRTVTSGRETPGGSPDCGHDPSSTMRASQYEYSYGGEVQITPPPLATAAPIAT